jgi:hypothetical protein
VQRRLAAFKLEGHVSSVSSVFFALSCPFSLPEAEDLRDSENDGSVREFSMILSTSNDMSAIVWSPLLTSFQLKHWNSSVLSNVQAETTTHAINRSPDHKKGTRDFVKQYQNKTLKPTALQMLQHFLGPQ